MKFNTLKIENFRGIEVAELSGLGDMVMIAGPNGCGKSCVLDAIRLLKSTYGGYQPNEWQQWFGEFKINLQQDPQQLRSLLRSKARNLVVEATIELSSSEKDYLAEEGRALVEELVWRTVIPGLNDPWVRNRAALASELRAQKPTVDARTDEVMPIFNELLGLPAQRGRFVVEASGKVTAEANVLLEVVFGSYKPGKLGLVDYHGAHRNYAREQFGGINLNIEQSEENIRKHALYNSTNKYSNIKSEMAAIYIRALLAERAGSSTVEGRQPLTETLKELFSTFFPGKEFLGPIPTERGGLDFPVRLPNGLIHDIDELSSGEKEVLFGYLRLRNTAPSDSLILLDEPELHLNPALVRGLPQFYQEHLGRALGNQIWLVTHSDAFLRESVGAPGFSVVHMRDAALSSGLDNQIHPIAAQEELEAAVIDLVGDLATYRPGGTVVILEGEDSEFDRLMVSRLFPNFEKLTNLVSAGNRRRVRRLQELLDAAAKEGGLPSRFYSIVDRDTQAEEPADSGRQFSWDVYHIENYLLEFSFIWKVLEKLGVGKELSGEKGVEQALQYSARETLDPLVCHRLREIVNRHVLDAVGLRVSPVAKDAAGEFDRATDGIVSKLLDLRRGDLCLSKLQEMEKNARKELLEALENGRWRAEFRGRDILRRFAGKYVDGMRYEYFRDLIIAEMRDAGHEPDGMKRILDRILSDQEQTHARG